MCKYWWIGWFHSVKTQHLPRSINRFNVSLSNPNMFSCRNQQAYCKTHVQIQMVKNSWSNTEQMWLGTQLSSISASPASARSWVWFLVLQPPKIQSKYDSRLTLPICKCFCISEIKPQGYTDQSTRTESRKAKKAVSLEELAWKNNCRELFE